MTFTPVEELPNQTNSGRKSGDKVSEYHKYEKEFDAFMRFGHRIVKVNYFDEFVSYKSAAKSLHRAVQRLGYPIDVRTRNGEVYLVRRDI